MLNESDDASRSHGMGRRGVLRAGEKVQFTDRKGRRVTAQLRVGGITQTSHGLIEHDGYATTCSPCRVARRSCTPRTLPR